jgi:hypothetical protein
MQNGKLDLDITRVSFFFHFRFVFSFGIYKQVNFIELKVIFFPFETKFFILSQGF